MTGLKEAKPAATPGEDEKKWEQEENAQLLDAGKATLYRKVAARLNYLALDRVDIMYAVKEV